MLHAHEWGRDGDVPVVFWHALGPDASGAELRPVGPVIAAAGFHVLAVDAPGFGRSPRVPPDAYRLDALADLLREWLDDRGLDRPVVMGHSWGATVAVRYAATNPDDVRALVLFDSGHLDVRELDSVDETRPLEAWTADLRARWQELETQMTVTTPAEVQAAAMVGMLEPISPDWRVLAEREIATLLYLATLPPHVDDNRKHVGRFQSTVPHADVRWPPNASHNILADVGPPLGEEIAAWLVERSL